MFKFKHFLVTRFNVKPVNDKLQVVDKIYTDEWIEKRLNLFREYCLPSILNQDCNNFHWLIYLDKDTKDKYKDEFNKLLKSCPFPYEIRYVHDAVLFLEDVKEFVLNTVEDKSTHIVTTRLDSDDAFHRQAISRLQKYIDDNSFILRDNKTALNLLKGYQLRVIPYYELVWKKIPSNPFVSLISKIDMGTVDIVYNYFHNDLGNIKVIDIDDDFYWLQTIHTNNMTSDVIGWPTIKLQRIKEFGFDTNHINISQKTFLLGFYNRVKVSITSKIFKSN
jgi:hypothetical protein